MECKTAAIARSARWYGVPSTWRAVGPLRSKWQRESFGNEPACDIARRLEKRATAETSGRIYHRDRTRETARLADSRALIDFLPA